MNSIVLFNGGIIVVDIYIHYNGTTIKQHYRNSIVLFNGGIIVVDIYIHYNGTTIKTTLYEFHSVV